MCPFVETIHIRQGEALRLSYHQRRLNDTLRHFWPGCQPIDLAAQLAGFSDKPEGKCRVVYTGDGIQEMTFAPYCLRRVQSLRLVEADGLDYTYKSTDREALNRFFARRGDADDVLLVCNGRVTDTSIANVAFYDGETWCTPATPLLKGTHRAALLDMGVLREKELWADELSAYSRVRLFNAMIDWGELDLPIETLKKF